MVYFSTHLSEGKEAKDKSLSIARTSSVRKFLLRVWKESWLSTGIGNEREKVDNHGY